MKKFYVPVVVLALAFVACSKDDDKKDTTPVVEAPKDSVVTYTNVNFSTKKGDATYGRAFSSLTGKVYRDSAIPDTMGKHIDVVFGYLGTSVLYFTSPNDADLQSELGLTIKDATASVVTNYLAAGTMAKAKFDTITHASTLNALEVIGDDDSFSSSSLPHAVYFKNSKGKKGVIMVKTVSGDQNYVTADVKVEY